MAGGLAHGEIHGARWVAHGGARVLALDGSDDYVDCGRPAALDIRGPITVSAWIWPDEVPPREVGIVGKQFSSYLLTMYTNGLVYWYVGSGGNSVSAGIPVGTWSHVVCTFDGKKTAIYMNGKLTSARPSKFDHVPAGGNFTIGCVTGDETAADANYQLSGFFKGRVSDVKVYDRPLGAEEIGREYVSGMGGKFRPVLVRRRPVRARATVGAGELTVKVGEKGGVQIGTGRSFCIVNTTYSYPDDGKAGSNALSESPGAGADPAWQPRVTKLGPNEVRIEASGRYYSLRRTVRVHARRVEFEDELTSRAQEPVGVLIDNRVITQKAIGESQVGSGPPDPFVYGRQKGYDLGIVAEDFVSRANFAAYVNANVAGHSVNHFALDKGKSHTFRWSVYILAPEGDVYALINRVRADWGVNHTIHGPCSFFNVTDPLLKKPAALKAFLKRKKLKVCMISPWLDYDPGVMDHVLTRPEYKKLVQEAVRAIKAADPEIKCIGCIETDWITLYPERIKNGDKLPSHGGGATGHAYLNEEQARILREANLPWKDSTIVRKGGKIRLEIYSRGGKPQLALNVIPGPGNYQDKFLMEQARFLCEEVGLDGFYIDEFVPDWLRSYHTWDGYTADIDPTTGEIIERYVNPGIYGVQTRLKLCRYAKERGAVMVANTFAASTEVAQLPTMRFAETWSKFHADTIAQEGKPEFIQSIARGRFGTPIHLGTQALKPKGREGHLLVRALIAYLRHGGVYYHYGPAPVPPESGPGAGGYGPINHMFPITPVRLFEGGIIGEERTITCLSGEYTWAHSEKPKVFTFDHVGREKESDARIERAGPGWTVHLKLSDWNEIAVIEG